MNRKRSFSRLGLKLFGVFLLGLLLALSLFAAINGLVLPWLLYSDRFESFWRDQSAGAVRDYQAYVEESGMTVQEVLLDQNRSRMHPSVQMYTICASTQTSIEGGTTAYTLITTAGWTLAGDDKDLESTSGTVSVYQDGAGAFYPITCGNGEVVLAAGPNDVWYSALGRIVGLLAAVCVFCAAVIPYICRLLGRISRLSRETEVLMAGDLEHSIRMEGRDELSQLGHSMEQMRRSVLERIAEEREALRANTQLITSLSHDLRTPLTKLLGYLEILNFHRYETEQERSVYLRRATDTAILLKEMGDEMFSRFQMDWREEEGPELVDGAELLGQILAEQCYDLQREGFGVEPPVFGRPFPLRVRAADVLRVFDNLFSNLKKYADKTRFIRITAEDGPMEVKLRMENTAARAPDRSDSHGIGIPTAAVLMERCGGRLETVHLGGTYRCVLTFPKAGEDSEEDTVAN